MPTPTNRTPVRVARGTYSNLNSSVADIQEGEIVYATDQDKLYVKEGSALVSTQATVDISGKANLASPTFTGTVTIPSGASIADIGTTIQAFDADTAKTDTAQTFTAPQRGAIEGFTVNGASITPYWASANNYAITLTVNSTMNNGQNITAGQSGSIFITQDGTGSRTLAWGSYWKFAGGTAPTLTTTAGAVDRVDYVIESTTSIHAVFTGNYSWAW